MKNKIKKVIGGIAMLCLCIGLSLKFIDSGSAENIICSSEAKLQNGLCVCKDPKKIYQGGSCAIDPTNLCPPDSKQVGANCICNDKNTVYDGVICVTKPDVQCAYEGGEYKNGRCDFTKALFAPAPTAIAPITTIPEIKIIVPVVKVLDLNSLVATQTTQNPNVIQAPAVVQVPVITQNLPSAPVVPSKTTTTNTTDVAGNLIGYNINKNIDSIGVYIK